jgi:hypothetical protein
MVLGGCGLPRRLAEPHDNLRQNLDPPRLVLVPLKGYDQELVAIVFKTVAQAQHDVARSPGKETEERGSTCQELAIEDLDCLPTLRIAQRRHRRPQCRGSYLPMLAVASDWM